MRLNKQSMDAVGDVAKKACGGRCHIEVGAPNRSMAAAMFRAVSPHIEPAGGAPVMRSLSWRFANGSTIAIVVRAEQRQQVAV